jgi:release factor H-coupled RctB family protein
LGSDAQKFLQSKDVNCTQFDRSLGTIGGGNHFAELQRVHEVYDQDYFESIGLDADHLYLLVHSGSRGVGEHILQEHSTQFGTAGLGAGSAEAAAYLANHDHAIAWARVNRELIALRFMDALGTRGKCLIDICHNFVQPGIVDGAACWLHRKGAAPSDVGPVVIAGSRGSASYLVVARGDQSKSLSTVAHGAGAEMEPGRLPFSA